MVTFSDIAAISPLVIMALAPIIVMLCIAFVRSHLVIASFTAISFLVALCSVFCVSSEAIHKVEPLLVVDAFTRFYWGLIFLAGAVLSVISYYYFRIQDEEKEEFYILLMLATLGSAVLVASNHLISFFVGLELLSISAYIMVAYMRKRDESIEAAIKYLILAAVSSAFLLFGMGLVYLASGQMSFSAIGSFVAGNGFSAIMAGGLAMMFVGIGFKLALVPFHMWTPDVYQGAPAPVTAFLSSISKTGVFALVLRFFVETNFIAIPSVILVLAVISIITMFAGNLLALRQLNIKRMLAYSSIAHLGYLLLTILSVNDLGMKAAAFYLTIYTITSLGAFGVLAFLSASDKDLDLTQRLKGLFYSHPVAAFTLSVMLLSLAGIPLTAGFIGKFYVVASGFKAGYIVLAILLIINSIISLYYYLKVVAILFSKQDDETLKISTLVPIGANILLVIILLSIIWLGIMPGALLG